MPVGASREAVVQCPLCSAQFPLREILAQLPPSLVVIHDPATDGTGAVARESEDWVGAEKSAVTESSVESGETPAFHFEAGSAASVRPRVKRVARPRARPSSPVRQIVQIVLGGVVGIGLAQVILWWLPVNLSVENRDLTGLGRKYGRYVPFLVPASVRESQSDVDDLATAASTRRNDSQDLVPVKPGRNSAKTVPGFQFTKSRLRGTGGDTKSAAAVENNTDVVTASKPDTAAPKNAGAVSPEEKKPASPESKPASAGEASPSATPDAVLKTEPAKSEAPAPTPSQPEASSPQASAPIEEPGSSPH